MQNANLPREGSEEHGSKVTDMPPQPAAPGFARASMIERAAQHLDWTVAYGKRQSTARELEETTSQRRRPDPPRSVRALWLRSNRAWGLRLLSISRVFLASVLAAAATGIGIFLLMHSASEKAESTNALATEAPAKTNEGASLMRGLAMMPPAGGTAQNVTLAEPVPTPAASEWEAKPTLGPVLSPPGWPKPEPTATPAKTLPGTSIFAAPAPRNQPVPAFNAAELAGLLARGDWLLAKGDITSARLLYERAAGAGEARAAVRLGETFDPVYLEHSHLRGLQGDPDTAVFWYRHARDLGGTGVDSRLKKLEARNGRN